MVLVVAALAAVLLHREIPIPKRSELGESFVPRPEVAKLASLGFRTLMADYYWLQAVQIVGAALIPADHGTVLGRYVDVVTTVDPWVDHPYRFAGIWLTGSEEDVREGNRILRRSFEYHPDEWRNPFYLGFNLFHHLGEDLEAAQAFERAARLPGSPPHLIGLAARLRAGKGDLVVAERLILDMRDTTQDEKKREQYEETLVEIATEKRALLLDRAREEYKKRNGEDIVRVEDLVRGPQPVLNALPPEPNGAAWVLLEETGEIVSSQYNHRYRPHATYSKVRGHYN